MAEIEVSFTSLCCLTEDYEGNVWLYRLADIENNRLHLPFKTDRQDNYFENRDRLYRNDGPSTKGTIGVWEWTAIPNRNNPDTDYVQTYYVQKASPIRVVVVKAVSLEDLAGQLKNGTVTSQTYICDTLFCYEHQGGRLTGVLCTSDEFMVTNKIVKIKEDVCTLPYYTICASDVYCSEDKELRFYRSLSIGEPAGFFPIENPQVVVRRIFLERITWPLFKECIGATKAEWRHSKTLLERIAGESLYNAVSEKLKCTGEQARQAVNDFVKHASMMISSGDIDADVLSQIAIQHEGLRSICEEAVANKWKEDHATDIAEAEEEIRAIKAAAEVEVAEIRQKLQDITQQVETAESNKEKILSEIDDAQTRRNQLLAEIDRYEVLGNNALVAMREKIATAQQDMATFIADISVFLPSAQPQTSTQSQANYHSLSYDRPLSDEYSDGDLELSESWHDEVNAIRQNLARALSINGDIGNMLAAFLYAAHHHQIPLLIVGPSGRDIADVVSVSIYASRAGHLRVSEELTTDIVSSLADYDESIICVWNMFGKGWNDEFPQEMTRLKKHIIWTHPYVEDLIIEPKGLFNYMLPVLSESFIGAVPSLKLFPSKHADKFDSVIFGQPQPLKMPSFKRLKISKLLSNLLAQVLSDAKTVLNQPSKDKDMEILFGLLPLCVVTGQMDILKETVDTENGISSAVKAEVMRYIEEE